VLDELLKKILKKSKTYDEVKNDLQEMITHNKSMDHLEGYIQDLCLKSPKHCIKYKRAFFVMIKDIAPEIAIKYGEDVINIDEDLSFIKVLLVRYKRIGNIKRYNELISQYFPTEERLVNIHKNSFTFSIPKKFSSQKFKSTLNKLLEEKTPTDTIISFINQNLNKFPKNKLSIAKTSFSILKDKYTTDSLKYGEIVLEKEQEISFLQVFLTRCKKIKDEEKIYKYSKIAYELTNDSKYMNDILIYENKDTIKKLQNMFKNNQLNQLEEEIENLLNNFKQYQDVIYTIASEVYTDFDISKSIEYMKKAIEINNNENLYMKLFSLYIKKGDLNKAVESVPNNITNKTLKNKLRIWKGNIDLLNNGFHFPNEDKILQYTPTNKILYLLHNSLPFHSGGYATRAHGLMEGTNGSSSFEMQGVSRLGYPKDILKLDSDDDIAENEKIDEILYHRLKSDTRRGNATYYEYIKEYGERVVELAKKEKPFVIHAASNLYNGLACVYAAKKLGIKSIYEIRGLWEITRISREAEWIDTDMYKFNADMETTAAMNADVVITITQALKDEMVKRGVPAEKIQILPNGVVSDRFKPLDRNEKLAKELNIEGKTVIGFIGSFVQYEGLEYIVDAVEILVNKGKKDIVALMVGDGAVWQEIVDRVEQKGLQEYFIFTGRIPHEEVEEYYSLVDIAPLPRKGLPVCEMVSPLKPFEAMAMEKVVLSSDVAALAEIVEDGYNGMLFEKDNVQDLADKIELLANDSELREKLGKQAREWVVKERDWSVLSQRLVKIYEKLNA